jgi:predicted acetyltransferase
MAIRLEKPHSGLLDSYVAALRTGWSPSNTQDLSGKHLAAIAANPAAFLADYEWQPGRTVELPSGRVVRRLPGQVYWISDGEFCGFLGLRYQPGTLALPPHVSGHVGYGVVPWKRRQGIARAAVLAALPLARAAGLDKVSITTSETNIASQAVIRSVGGIRAPEVDGADDHGAYIGFWVEADLSAARPRL